MSIKALTTTALLVSSFCAGAAPEKPTRLTTGVLAADTSAGTYLACYAVNVSDTPLTMTVELINHTGGVRASSTGSVQPSMATGFGSTIPLGFCRVTFQGSAGAVRAAICTYQNGSCISSLEAR